MPKIKIFETLDAYKHNSRPKCIKSQNIRTISAKYPIYLNKCNNQLVLSAYWMPFSKEKISDRLQTRVSSGKSSKGVRSHLGHSDCFKRIGKIIQTGILFLNKIIKHKLISYIHYEYIAFPKKKKCNKQFSAFRTWDRLAQNFGTKSNAIMFYRIPKLSKMLGWEFQKLGSIILQCCITTCFWQVSTDDPFSCSKVTSFYK